MDMTFRINLKLKFISLFSVLGMGFFWGLMLFCNHIVFAWVWMAVRLIETVDVHSGYDIPYVNVLHLIPGYGGRYFYKVLRVVYVNANW